MNLSFLYNEILYKPLFNALVFVYNYTPFGDLGIAIIILTIIIRVILLPLFYKSAKDQAILARLAPKIKEIQESHKDNKQTQALALMQLYKEHKVNPFSGFLLLLVQLPIIIALYQVFLKGINPDLFSNLYSFVSAPQYVNHNFLNLIDLSQKSFVIVGLAAIAQYIQGRLSLPKNNNDKKNLSPMEAMTKQMVFIGPIMTVLFLSYLPAAIGVYWLTTSIFSVIQQIIINKELKGETTEELVKEHEKIHHA